jgi:hypothetical protein
MPSGLHPRIKTRRGQAGPNAASLHHKPIRRAPQISEWEARQKCQNIVVNGPEHFGLPRLHHLGSLDLVYRCQARHHEPYRVSSPDEAQVPEERVPVRRQRYPAPGPTWVRGAWHVTDPTAKASPFDAVQDHSGHSHAGDLDSSEWASPN